MVVKSGYKSRIITSRKSNLPQDLINNEYLVAQRDGFWCIDATFIGAGTLLIVIDLATRLILGDFYLHKQKSNEFTSQDVKALLSRCLQARSVKQHQSLVIHSDRGKQFTSKEFLEFCEQVGVKQSMNETPFNNQVIESLNRRIKHSIRLKIDPQGAASQFKPGSFADPLRKLGKLDKEQILQAIQFAIDTHNNANNNFNQTLSPFEFDNALFDSKALTPKVISSKNDNSENALIVQEYRDQVTLEYAGSWVEFFKDWKQKQDIQFEMAKRERALLYEQNRLLISKIEQQSSKIDQQSYQIEEQTSQIQQILELHRLQQEKEDAKALRRAKRSMASKRLLRDAMTSEEFQQIMQNVEGQTLKNARLRVAFTILYLTGLRVSNLLNFTISNLNELIQKQSTLITIIKGGGPRKIILGREAKRWFKEIESDVALLQQNREPGNSLFSNQKGEPISRIKFNEQLNGQLKKISIISGKRFFTHSFRVSMITELLRHKSIQDVKRIIGHRDIRTTEVYNRNFPNEREYYQAMQHVYKARAKRARNKTGNIKSKVTLPGVNKLWVLSPKKR